MKIDDIPYGKYQHYKTGKVYEMIGIARHSETYGEMVIYRALYQCMKENQHRMVYHVVCDDKDIRLRALSASLH